MNRAYSLPLLVLLSAGLPAAQEPNVAPATASAPAQPPKETSSDLQKAAKEIDLKRELSTIEEVWRRRTALHYLKEGKEAAEAIWKTVDPQTASTVKKVLEKNERFVEFDYHYQEKVRNAEARLLARLRLDRFNGLQDVVEVVSKKNYPVAPVFANLLHATDLHLRFAVRRGEIPDKEFAKEWTPKLTAEVLRVQGTAGHPMKEVAAAIWKETKPEEFPVHWFDFASEIVAFQFGEIPPIPGETLVDLNRAEKGALLGVPEVTEEVADAILKHRRKTGFQGPEELRFLPEVPSHLVDALSTFFAASGVVRPKKWTLMVYLNAANNLEPFGIEDMNEMEKIGSTPDVNVVVEIDRFRSEQKVRPNPQYFSNPYQEFEGVFYWGMDSSGGARRYYMLKDDDPVRVRSAMKMQVGETDAGDPRPLIEFGKWAVENYPAERYALVIWDHGGGWSGVSVDENTNRVMDLQEVSTALAGIRQALAKQGKEKIDILDFDACLMATVEVARELEPHVDFLVSSQESEPGDGMPYDDYLEFLSKYPEIPPAGLAKNMVDTYVKSYLPSGSQAEGEEGGFFGATKSAIALARVPALCAALDSVAGHLMTKKDLLGEVIEEIYEEARNYGGGLVDLYDFTTKVAQNDKTDAKLKEAVEKVADLVGYPEEGKDPLVNEVVIRRRSPGAVVWGFNGWAMPPRSLAPFVHQGRALKTPLTGPDEKGDFVARLEFPPMLQNPKTAKRELVKEINWRFEDEQEKRTASDFKNFFVTTAFDPQGALVGEGHLVGNNRSHGLSIYFPRYLGYSKEYGRLKFAAETRWDDLIATFPIKKVEDRAPIVAAGLRHATKKDRERLGEIVIKKEFAKASRRYDFAASTKGDLDALGAKVNVIKDPRPYGEDWQAMLSHYVAGTALLDNHSAGPGSRDLLRFLQSGGHALLGSSEIVRAMWDIPLYERLLGLRYVGKEDLDYSFRLAGREDTFELEPARKAAETIVFEGREGVAPFATLKDGRMIGAKIARKDPETGAEFRAVVLGFYWADVKGDENRRALLRSALEFLGRGPQAPVEASAEKERAEGSGEAPARKTGAPKESVPGRREG